MKNHLQEFPNRYIQKNLLCIWWDCKGVIYQEVLEESETITAEKYSQQLDRLNQAIQILRPQIVKKGVILQHDNARPHTARITKATIVELG